MMRKRLVWDADPRFEEPAGEQWLVLLEKKFNKPVHYSTAGEC